MKLPNVRRILKEDLGGIVPDWTLGLIGPLNSFMESVYQTLNRNVTFSENIASFIVELIIKTDGSGVISETTFLNQLKGGVRAQAVLVCQIYNKVTYAPIANTGMAWSTDGVNITISEINGLDVSSTYVARLLIF